MTEVIRLPVPVLENPHWRVNYRPSTYDPSRVPSLRECVDLVRRTQVRLRGWDFPHIPPRQNSLAFGSSWVAAASDAFDHYEYWRFYQSTQFLYLGSVREVTEKPWHERIRANMEQRLPEVDMSLVPGFVSITEFIYTSTEIFEFAARLAQASVYLDPLTVLVSLKGVRGFLLAADPDRHWRTPYAAALDNLDFEVTVAPQDLIAQAAAHALNCSLWFFERFGWINPSIDVLKSDQQKLLKRQF